MTKREKLFTFLVIPMIIGWGVMGLVVLVTDRHPAVSPVALTVPAPGSDAHRDYRLLCEAYRLWVARVNETVEGMENLCRER